MLREDCMFFPYLLVRYLHAWIFSLRVLKGAIHEYLMPNWVPSNYSFRIQSSVNGNAIDVCCCFQLDNSKQEKNLKKIYLEQIYLLWLFKKKSVQKLQNDFIAVVGDLKKHSCKCKKIFSLLNSKTFLQFPELDKT